MSSWWPWESGGQRLVIIHPFRLAPSEFREVPRSRLSRPPSSKVFLNGADIHFGSASVSAD